MTAPRIAKNFTAAGVLPYTSDEITLLPIKKGTFVNTTHVSSTFLCGGCINKDSFDASADDAFFSYAYSHTIVDNPSDINTSLSDHTFNGRGYGTFGIPLSKAKSSDYEKYAEMADMGLDSIEPEHPKPQSPSTQTPTMTLTTTVSPTVSPTKITLAPVPFHTADGGKTEPVCERPISPDFSHRDMPLWGIFVLAVLGSVYLVQAFVS
ncbi:hypothetical protein N0V88_002686 [Collariella sp. IMI 366227]|nr:hypothetical protein N0V88_002686 [Collariella sp. IMI 366227]